MLHFTIDGFRGFRSRFDDAHLIQEVLEDAPAQLGLKRAMPAFVLDGSRSLPTGGSSRCSSMIASASDPQGMVSPRRNISRSSTPPSPPA